MMKKEAEHMKKRWLSRLLLLSLLLTLLPPAAAGAAEPQPWNGGGTAAAQETPAPAVSETPAPEARETPKPVEEAPELPQPETAAEPREDIVDPYRLYTYESMVVDLAALQYRYPDLISVATLGESVEGREIPMFTLGKGKREIILCGGMHAREYITVNFLMYMTEHYCIGYVNDEDYRGYNYRLLLDNVRFVVVPMLNPDGVALAQQGENYANVPEDIAPAGEKQGGYHAWKSNIRGVDLNANWPYRWNSDRKAKSPSYQNYPGPEPLSEPETQAMAALLAASPFYALCSFHTSGEIIYWIDNSNSREMYERYRPTVDRLAQITGYTPLGYENVTAFGGYMVNYARAVYDRMCMTIEISPFYSRYPFTDYKGFQKIVEKVYPACLVIADAVINMEPLTPQAEDSPARDTVDVMVDGKLLAFADQRPVVRDGNTLCPLRTVCEACGLSVTWNADTQAADITNGKKTIHIQVGNAYLWNGSIHLPMPVAPELMNGRVVLPLRAVLEQFGMTVGWNGETATVLVYTNR